MSKPAHPTAAPPSFWRWFWHEQAQRPTGRQLAFAFLFTTGVTIPMITGWYRVLLQIFPLIDVESGAAVLAAVLVAFIGVPFAAATAYTCRPSGWRVYLWTGFAAVVAGLVAQAGIVANVALTLGWSITWVGDAYMNRVVDQLLSLVLTFIALLPALGVVMAASWFLYWPRVLAERTNTSPPAA